MIKKKSSVPPSLKKEVKKKTPTSLRNIGTGYTKAFVTFIDILGFRQIVADKKPDEINNILDIMGLFSAQPQLRRDPYSKTKHLPMILQFSDSIIRIQPVDEKDEDISVLDLFDGELSSLLLAQGNLVCNGVLIRGGITYGEVCVLKDRVFGPAFNRAYYIESSLARYPRIVIDECLCMGDSCNPIINLVGHHDWTSAISHLYEYMERSDDGQWGIEYLSHLYMACDKPAIQGIDVLRAHRDQLQKLVKDSIAKDNTEALLKIRWVASYHNRIISNNFRSLFEKDEGIGGSLLVSLD